MAKPDNLPSRGAGRSETIPLSNGAATVFRAALEREVGAHFRGIIVSKLMARARRAETAVLQGKTAVLRLFHGAVFVFSPALVRRILTVYPSQKSPGRRPGRVPSARLRK